VPPRGRRSPRVVGLVVLVVAVAIAASSSRYLVGALGSSAPSQSEPSEAVLAALSPPSLPPAATTTPSSWPFPSSSRAASPIPSPTASPKPVRHAIDVNIEGNPKAVFRTEILNTWCAAAAVQMALNVIGPTIDVSTARQKRIHLLEVAATTRADSRSGGVGPLGMVATLDKLGTVRYELRIYRTRAGALLDAARAIIATRHPVILMAWRGAHAWVMTGFRADADPRYFSDAHVAGTYILDAWYPRISSIWGPSDPPGTYQNAAEMTRNYLPWKRPEAHYPGRDGRFLALVPTDAPKG
jgi:hypothetical protein